MQTQQKRIKTVTNHNNLPSAILFLFEPINKCSIDQRFRNWIIRHEIYTRESICKKILLPLRPLSYAIHRINPFIIAFVKNTIGFLNTYPFLDSDLPVNRAIQLLSQVRPGDPLICYSLNPSPHIFFKKKLREFDKKSELFLFWWSFSQFP